MKAPMVLYPRSTQPKQRYKEPKVLLRNKALAIVLTAFFAFSFGCLVGQNALLAIMLVAIPVLLLFFYNPTIAFYIFIASLPLYVVAIPGFPASVPRVVGTLLFIVWAPYVFFTRKFKLIKFDQMLVLMIIFYAWLLLSSTWTIHQPGAYIIIRVLTQLIVAVFIAITLIDTREKFNPIVVVVLLTCMLAGYRSFGMSLISTERAVGIEGFDQNEFAAMLLTPLLIAFALFNYHSTRWKQAAMIIVMFGCFLGSLSTVSRGFVISVTASFAVLYALEPNKRKMLILLLIAFLITSPYFLKRYGDRIGSERFELTAPTEVPVGRLAIWTIAWDILKNHPIIGVGTGGFVIGYDEELMKDPTRVSYNKAGRVAHNDYFTIACELGLIGLILWLLFIWAVIRKGLRTKVILERCDDQYLAAVTRGLLSGYAGLLVAAIFLNLYASKYMWLGFIMFILLSNIARNYKKTTSNEEIKRLPDP